MLTIRLTRRGKTNQPFFKVVVIDKRRSSKGGRAVEEVGYVDPLTKRKSLNKDRILYWINNGAQPTDRIHNLLVSEKIIDDTKVKRFSVTKRAKAASAKAVADAAAAAEAEKAAKAAAEAAPAPAPETPAAPAENLAPETPAEETPKV